MAQRKPLGAVVARFALLVSVIVTIGAVLAVPVIVGVRFSDRFATLAWRVSLISIGAIAVAVLARRLLPSQPRRIVLDLDLTSEIPEAVAPSPLAALKRPKFTVRDVVAGLERAAADKRVVGLVARLNDGVLAPGATDEIRAAVATFAASGKRAVAFSDTMGEGSGGTGVYHLATAFSEIVVQPSGEVGLTGLYSASPFLRGAFDKLGLDPRFDHRHEYKAAKNMLTETDFTPAHKESVDAILDSTFAHVTGRIAEARGLTVERVQQLIDQAPLSAAEALEAGLIDRLAYRDEVADDVIGEGRGSATAVPFATWWKRAKRKERGATVALVYGVGAIARGKSRFEPPYGQSMGGDTVAAALRAARKDKKVKAILFRVNSPGGSAVASDTIWREVVRAKEDGKPVVVSMGDVAGSGGYWVSMHADRIIAQPTTITGSIGVVSGKFVSTELRDKIGVAMAPLRRGARSGMYSHVEDFTDDEWEKLGQELDRIYDDFVGKVADGRGMTREQVHEVAKGRVWTGADALERGLVDELGGFPEALAAIRELAGLGADGRIKLKEYPKKKGPLGFLSRGSDPSDDFALMPALPAGVREIADLAGALAPPAGPVAMPPGLDRPLRF